MGENVFKKASFWKDAPCDYQKNFTKFLQDSQVRGERGVNYRYIYIYGIQKLVTELDVGVYAGT